MDLRTITETLKAIPQMQREIEELKLQILELALNADNAQLDISVDEQPADLPADSQPELAAKIEQHVLDNIHKWKWTVNGRGCPKTATDMAHVVNGDVNDIRKLIAIPQGMDPTVWRKIMWMQLPPPDGHPDAERCHRMQWVVLREP